MQSIKRGVDVVVVVVVVLVVLVIVAQAEAFSVQFFRCLGHQELQVIDASRKLVIVLPERKRKECHEENKSPH